MNLRLIGQMINSLAEEAEIVMPSEAMISMNHFLRSTESQLPQRRKRYSMVVAGGLLNCSAARKLSISVSIMRAGTGISIAEKIITTILSKAEPKPDSNDRCGMISFKCECRKFSP